MTDHVERLIAAWLAWERAPRNPAVCTRRLDVITAAGLNTNRAHESIAAARRAGLSIPDAVQTVLNDKAA